MSTYRSNIEDLPALTPTSSAFFWLSHQGLHSWPPFKMAYRNTLDPTAIIYQADHPHI